MWPIAILEAVSDSVRTSADITKTLDILLWPAPLSLILPLLPKDLARFLDFTQYFALFAAPFALAGLADLDNDGRICRQASAALVFEAEPAFLIGDSLERSGNR